MTDEEDDLQGCRGLALGILFTLSCIILAGVLIAIVGSIFWR